MSNQSIKTKLTRFISFFRSSKASDNDDTLSTKTGGARLQRRSDLTDTSQFQEYLHGIPKHQMTLIKSRKGLPSRTTTSNLQIPPLLTNCYQQIPQEYFKGSQFTFDSSLLHKSLKKTTASHEKLSTYLDHIEVCLFNQVTSRFDEFISVVRTIQAMDVLVQENLHRVKDIRRGNKGIGSGLVRKAMEVERMVIRVRNMGRVRDIMQKMKMALQCEATLLNPVNKPHRLQLLSTYSDLLPIVSPLVSLPSYPQTLTHCSTILHKDLAQSFSQSMFAYVTKATEYKPQFWTKLSSHSDLLQGQFRDGNATMLLEEESLYEDRCRCEEAVERAMAVGVRGMGSQEGQGYQGRLEGFVQGVWERFLKDLTDFTGRVIKEAGIEAEGHKLSELLPKMSIEFFSKVLEYYSTLHLNYLRRQFSLCKTIATSTPHQSPQITTLNQIRTFLSQLVIQKINQLVTLFPINCSIDFHRLKAFLKVLEKVELFFKEDADNSTKEANQIWEIRQSIVNKYIQQRHKSSLKQLKTALQEDTWSPVDIPTEFYECLGYILMGQAWQNRKNLQITMLQSSIFFSAIRTQRPSQPTHTDQPEQPILDFKIIKTQCVIQGQSYKFSSSLMKLLETIESYLRISRAFRYDMTNNLTELMRLYNSCSFQLIIGAGAVVLGRIKSKNITARHLCHCAACIQVLQLVSSRISSRLPTPIPDHLLLQPLSTHHKQLLSKLHVILLSKIQQCLQCLSLPVLASTTPTQPTTDIIASCRTLYGILQDFLREDLIGQVFNTEVLKVYVDHMERMQVTTLKQVEAVKQEMVFYWREIGFLAEVVHGFSAQQARAEAVLLTMFQQM